MCSSPQFGGEGTGEGDLKKLYWEGKKVTQISFIYHDSVFYVILEYPPKDN